jgi:hypothetical protein
MFKGERICVGLAISGIMLMAAAQSESAYAPPVDMPLDRTADSYAIYRQLLPSDAIEWSDAKRTQWLLQDVTIARPLSLDCNAHQSMADLSTAVAPTAERKADWDEVLADYGAHCHERYKLTSDKFDLALPVHLLDKDAQKRYWSGVSGFRPPKNNIMQAPQTPEEFKGAAGLHSFSAVYFNSKHTLAATDFGMGCGSLCGNATWVVLEKTSTGWRLLPWVHVTTFS